MSLMRLALRTLSQASNVASACLRPGRHLHQDRSRATALDNLIDVLVEREASVLKPPHSFCPDSLSPLQVRILAFVSAKVTRKTSRVVRASLVRDEAC